MSSNPNGDAFDLHRDLPTSAEDVRQLARLRAASPSWLALGRLPSDDSTALQALRARPTTREGHPPFELPGVDADRALADARAVEHRAAACAPRPTDQG